MTSSVGLLRVAAFMSKYLVGTETIRKLRSPEMEKFRDHLLRLDEDSRRTRFGMVVDDSFLEAYAERADPGQTVIYGYFSGGEMHAAAELRSIGDSWGAEAEIALSVEADYQDAGIGTDLLGRIIQAARNRGVDRLYMSCLEGNHRMQRIARKYDAELHLDHGEVIGAFRTPGPTPASRWSEAVDDGSGFVMAVLDLPLRLLPAPRVAPEGAQDRACSRAWSPPRCLRSGAGEEPRPAQRGSTAHQESQ
jgi:GNAT superfamily N-acetyltransferase